MNFIQTILLSLFLMFSLSGLCNFEDIQNEINKHVSTGNYDAAESYIEFELNKKHDSKTDIELKHQLVSVLIYGSKYKEALEVAFEAIDKISANQEKESFIFLSVVSFTVVFLVSGQSRFVSLW